MISWPAPSMSRSLKNLVGIEVGQDLLPVPPSYILPSPRASASPCWGEPEVPPSGIPPGRETGYRDRTGLSGTPREVAGLQHSGIRLLPVVKMLAELPGGSFSCSELDRTVRRIYWSVSDHSGDFFRLDPGRGKNFSGPICSWARYFFGSY